eukprot:TRINITY_DN8150_c0_g1_i1.p1 TRINITY_DN8150_c0_g1~~TRINITY_DN8150_c0_g1_i1.p1  ORF type:complete len:817 (+),score=125.65 TRINITY_DN8150_c0_g1_i1:185-2635(+)
MDSRRASLSHGFGLMSTTNDDDELLAGIIQAERDSNQMESSSHSSSGAPPALDTACQGLQIILKQKPRGSKGVWLPLSAGERVRVSDRKAGKNLRLLFISSRQDLNLDEIALVCFEKTTASSKKKASDWQPSPEADFPELKRTRLEPEGPNVIDMLEIEVKLLVMYRLVKFQVTIPSKNPAMPPLFVESIEFVTYNSGSEDSKKKKRSEGKTKTEKKAPVAVVHPVAIKPPPEHDQEETWREVVHQDAATSPLDEPNLVEDIFSPIPNVTASPSEHQSPSSSPSQPYDQEQVSSPPPMFDEDWSFVHANLSVEGLARAQQFMQFSDIRLKTDIQDICAAMDIVAALKGRSYRWKSDQVATMSSSASTSTDPTDDSTRGQRTLGFIAQELQRVVPEVVRETSSGYLTVAYAELIPILIEAFKFHMQKQRKAEASTQELRALAEHFAALKQSFSDQLKHASDRLSELESRTKPPRSPSRPKKRSGKSGQTSVEMQPLDRRPSRRKPIWALEGDADEKKKRPRSKKCCRDCSALKIIGGIVIFLLVGTAVALGIAFGIKPSAFSPQSPENSSNNTPTIASQTPAGFSTTNYYVGDPGFEDPTAQVWGGNHSYYQYGSSKRALQASRFPRVDNASSYFDAGRYAVYIYQEPRTAELPQFPSVGLQQIFDFPAVVQRLRALKNESTTNNPLSSANPPSNQTSTVSPNAPPVTMESLFLNITVWMNRDYANNPSIRDATWIPHDVWIGIRLWYDVAGSPPRETLIKQPLSPTLPRGWQLSWMAAIIPVPADLPLPAKASITFFSTMPGYIFFDAVQIDSRLV